GAELYASDRPGEVPRERLLTRFQVPDLHFPFLMGFPTACGGQALTVRAEGDTPHPAGVFPAKEWLVELALKGPLHPPNPPRLIPASRGEVPAVGAKPNRGCILLVSQPLLAFLAGFRLAESDEAVLRGRGQVLAVGAERDAVDAAFVAQREKGAVPQPLEVVP